MSAAADAIGAHVARRAPLERESRLADWELARTGAPAAEKESARLSGEIKRLLSDRAALDALERIRADGPDDPDEARQVELLRLDHARNQADAALLGRLTELEARAEGTYARFRPRLDGESLSENAIRGILRDSDDADRRRRAWEASKELGPVTAPLVREMVELRNRIARARGWRDFYAMDLELQEMDEDFLFGTLARLEELTAGPYDAMIGELFARCASRFRIAEAEVRPWHLADPFFQEAVAPPGLDLGALYAGADLVALTRDSFAAMGFDIASILERSDLFPREGKNQHAFCTHIDRSTDDIRVLCNVVPDDYWADTMLHEYGHAVYDAGLAPDLPWRLREAAHILSTEAIALLFGRLHANPDWLIRRLGAPEAAVDAVRAPLAAYARAKQLLFPRWVMVMVHFERALYEDPSRDLDRLWWDLVERFQKVPRPDGRSAPDWACKIHVALAPAYYHNYLLGDLMASQLDAWLAIETGGDAWFESADTAGLLGEALFAHGARRPWNDALERATGSRLDPAAYVTQFVTAPA